MVKRCKSNIIYIFLGLAILLFTAITFDIQAKDKNFLPFVKVLTTEADTAQPKVKSRTAIAVTQDTIITNKADTSVLKDTTSKKIVDSSLTTLNDSAKVITIDTLSFSQDSLAAQVQYNAEDSGVLIMSTRNFYLYGKASTQYQDLKLDANTIEYTQANQMIKAFGGVDTAQGALNKPKLVQAGSESISDTIFFNMKTQRGLTLNTFYKEDDIYVQAQRLKKVDKEVAFGYRTTFTTCNLDTPHFDFRARKIKIINNKIAVSGPANFEVEGVPLPLAIPFGIFPLNRGRHSGLLPPQFASNQDFGLGLEGLGYYKVLNDNWDVTVRSNIYSYGGWNLNIQPEYFKRYKYRGNLNLALQKTKILNSGTISKSEFTETSGFFITWTHSTDTRTALRPLAVARPWPACWPAM